MGFAKFISAPSGRVIRIVARFVSPKGLMKPPRPPYSQIVTGVVRGSPDFLPLTVSRTSGPNGGPSAINGLATPLKYGTHRGSPIASVEPAVSLVLVSFPFRRPPQVPARLLVRSESRMPGFSFRKLPAGRQPCPIYSTRKTGWSDKLGSAAK
jgi:hypothetical protein